MSIHTIESSKKSAAGTLIAKTPFSIEDILCQGNNNNNNNTILCNEKGGNGAGIGGGNSVNTKVPKFSVSDKLSSIGTKSVLSNDGGGRLMKSGSNEPVHGMDPCGGDDEYQRIIQSQRWDFY